MKNNENIRESTVVCPFCGAEYDASEVLYPDSVLGQVSTVIRDPLQKIIYREYKEDAEPLTEDTYICDHCGHKFVVEIETKYKAKKADESVDFGDLSASLK